MPIRSPRSALAHLLAALLRDRAGNTLALIAAAVVPVLALVGGGIDMGRSYLSQSRLQQACDAGVLAARKKLGSQVVTTGIIPDAVATSGNNFFNTNFRDGSYGTRNRAFQMTLEPDYAISGVANVDVPTTIMTLFGYRNMPIHVECSAKLNFSNTDVMFVLDTTGSMADTNPGDTQPKIDILRQVVKSFHAQLEGSKTPGTRIRYGFLPYSTNVNVGGILKPDWMVDRWTYQGGRQSHDTGTTTTGPVFSQKWVYVSGTSVAGASYVGNACPPNTSVWTQKRYWVDPDGTENSEWVVNGITYWCEFLDANTVRITPVTYTDYDYIYSYKNEGMKTIPVFDWRYQPLTLDVTSLKDTAAQKMLVGKGILIPKMGGDAANSSDFYTTFRGCIEERDTYEITDYNNVDLSRALDLDIDLVPTKGVPATQWRPLLNDVSFERSIGWGGSGTWSVPPVNYQWDYLNAWWANTSACPAPAQKLQTMDAGQVASYVDGLFAQGSTYHDIGMIWGARMLSPTGLFAAENADTGGGTTSRHLIFLTDGETAPRDLSYGTYGIEPLDQRRWHEGSALTLTQVVENRFTVACHEAQKRNITIWIIGFGTVLNPVMTACAGPGHSFEAKDAAELNNVFSRIAAQLGDLRLAR